MAATWREEKLNFWAGVFKSIILPVMFSFLGNMAQVMRIIILISWRNITSKDKLTRWSYV